MPDFSKPGPLTLSPAQAAWLEALSRYDCGGAFDRYRDHATTWRGEPLQESVELMPAQEDVPTVVEPATVPRSQGPR